MKTEYRYVHFVKVDQGPRTSVWTCRNNRSGGELGRVRWYGPWRQYCYFPVSQAVYSGGCLKDICSFLEELAEERKQQGRLVLQEGAGG
ncbi:unnamed protein product [marine sediment metagenome]|uniref:Uncharacterized protein n=1 Tax=marine sediment metagenome TaxID=412755 RepID=X0V0Z4_9ZZZZ